MKKQGKIGFMCSTDYIYFNEMGNVPIYQSIEDLKIGAPCWEGCGIVEVEIKVTSVAVKGKGHGEIKKD